MKVLKSVDLKKYNTYGIGGITKYLVSPSNVDDLEYLLKYLNEQNTFWYILGGGSNVILPDEDFNGVIIRLDKLDEFSIDGDIITAGAGISLGKFVKNMLDNGFTNYGALSGIPGLLGGAIIGNAGAYGVSVFDYLINVTIMDDLGNIRVLEKSDINYDYRYTEFKGGKNIIVAATFQGIRGDVAEELEKISDNMAKRRSTQPLEYKNAGSVFKNPPRASAGYLIEHAGLKGISVGGAKVSEKHANFIINYNNATSNDIKKLIDIIKGEVKKKFNEELELEQVIVKW